ncbi:hypothetical protein FBU31_005168, partial [Coemansia sp. 'formosensis']
MDDSDVFGGGFGAPRQQPFTFDTDEMNPFGDIESPWGAAVPATVETLDSAHAQSSEDENDDDEDDENSLRRGTERLHISTNSAEAPSGGASASLGSSSATEGQDGKPHSASAYVTPAVQTARRVGIIKRGLRSPRVLGKQLSATSFEDPLSSAVADEELENSPA